MAEPLSRARWRAALAVARARRRLRSGRGPTREEQIDRLAPGRSFCDVGCMWSVDGRYAFRAHDAGAREVTGIDLMGPTEAFLAEQGRRADPVRLVVGDVHDPGVVAEAGRSDVVFCSGLLYHSPSPALTVERLRDLCSDTLLLWTIVVPEVPGVAQAGVWFPGLGPADRRLYENLWTTARQAAISDPYRREEGYGNWFWGLSRSAVRGLLEASGLEVVEEGGDPLTASFTARVAD